MQISDHEIRESLRLLFEPPIGKGSSPAVDQDISRLVIGHLENLPDTRVQVVSALREAIQERRYYVPDEEVAQQIIGRFLADSLR
jgi:hypothetical protein